jgi:hypothetical protein
MLLTEVIEPALDLRRRDGVQRPTAEPSQHPTIRVTSSLLARRRVGRGKHVPIDLEGRGLQTRDAFLVVKRCGSGNVERGSRCVADQQQLSLMRGDRRCHGSMGVVLVEEALGWDRSVGANRRQGCVRGRRGRGLASPAALRVPPFRLVETVGRGKREPAELQTGWDASRVDRRLREARDGARFRIDPSAADAAHQRLLS